MKNLILSLVLLVAISIGFPNAVQAQLYDVPISTLSDHSSLVVEGRVVGKSSYWNSSHTRIYTQYQIEVSDVLRGRSNSIIDVIQLGGCVAEDCQTLFPRLEMGLGQEGIFFLRLFKDETLITDQLYQVVSGPLGFVSFQEMDNRVVGVNALRVFENLNAEIYLPIAGRLKKTSHEPVETHLPDAAPSISNFFPDTVAAGVKDTLTIEGNEFGLVTGKVWFHNADLGGNFFMRGEAPDIVIWSDTLIQVTVPSDPSLDSMRKGVAGTGFFRVETGSGGIALSPTELYIKYAMRTRRVILDSLERTVFLGTQVNLAGGGYVFQMDTGFSNTPMAPAVLKKAIRDWRCATGVNFSVGSDTTVREISRDSISIIYWDALDPGTLGQTLVDERFCFNSISSLEYYPIQEIDIRFDPLQLTYIDTVGSPGPGQNDFYSAVLHELGHGHLMEHVNRPGFLMHYTTTTGTTIRTINPEILEGTMRVMDSSGIGHGPSCLSPMIPVQEVDCNTLGISDRIQTIDFRFEVFPNPANTELVVAMDISKKLRSLKVEIVDLQGKLVQSESYGPVSPGTKIVEIDLENLHAGFFLIRVVSEGGAACKPVIIQR